VCGQLVCRYLRRELRNCRVVLKARKNCSVLELAAANLRQYQDGGVCLSLVNKAQHKIIFAVLFGEASRCGWYDGLIQLRCPYNNMTPKCAQRISRVLETCPNIRLLDLSENALLGTEISPIALALRSCSQLEELILQGLVLKAEGTRRLASALLHLPHLKHLDVRGNRLGSPCGNDGIQRLTAALPRCCSLLSLHLGDNLLMAQVLLVCVAV
jgi:hypothetical protein